VAHSGRDILLDQLAACQDDESWYVPLTVALDGLTAPQAASHEPGSTHSIWQIVSHLTFWNEQWLRRFQGDPLPSPPVNNDATFDIGDQVGGEVDWQEAVARLHHELSAWRAALAGCSEAKLDEPVPNFPVQAPWWGVVSNLATHNVYHIGQMVSIRKQQGNWLRRNE
jgi:uncharacterized damage-inducible protein DinB